MNRKQLRDFERQAECGRKPDGNAVRRTLTINLADAIVHKACPSAGSDFVECTNDDPTNHSTDRTLKDYIDAGELDAIVGTDSVRHISLAFLNTENGLSRGGFQEAYCGNGGGALGFDARIAGMYDLAVDNLDPSHVRVETQEAPLNLASCWTFGFIMAGSGRGSNDSDAGSLATPP